MDFLDLSYILIEYKLINNNFLSRVQIHVINNFVSQMSEINFK